jgi:hypothetical protein
MVAATWFVCENPRSQVMCRECRTIVISDPLNKTLERMDREGCATLAVISGSKPKRFSFSLMDWMTSLRMSL